MYKVNQKVVIAHENKDIVCTIVEVLNTGRSYALLPIHSTPNTTHIIRPQMEIKGELDTRTGDTPKVGTNTCYFCGEQADIYDKTTRHFACMECSDIDNGGGCI